MKLTRDILALSGRRKTAGAKAHDFAGRIAARRRVVWRRGDGSLLRLYRPARMQTSASPAPTSPSTTLVNVSHQTILRPRTVTTVLQTFSSGAQPTARAVDAAGRPRSATPPALRTRALQSVTPANGNALAIAQVPTAPATADAPTSAGAAPEQTRLRARDLILERETPLLRPRHRSSAAATRTTAGAALAPPPRLTHFVGRADAARFAARTPRMNSAERFQASERPTPTTLRRRADMRAESIEDAGATSRPAPNAEDAPPALQLRPDLRAAARAAVARQIENAARAAPDLSDAHSLAQARTSALHADSAAPRLDEATVASAVRRALETSPEIAPEVFIDRITAKLERRLRLEREWRGVR